MRMKLRNKYDLEGFDELPLSNQICVMFELNVILYGLRFECAVVNLVRMVKGAERISFDEFCKGFVEYYKEVKERDARNE